MAEEPKPGWFGLYLSSMGLFLLLYGATLLFGNWLAS
jgi:hypothetical protein